MLKTMKTLINNDKLITAGLDLIKSTPLEDFPERRPIFDLIYDIAKQRIESKHLMCKYAREYIAEYNRMVNHFVDLNDNTSVVCAGL